MVMLVIGVEGVDGITEKVGSLLARVREEGFLVAEF